MGFEILFAVLLIASYHLQFGSSRMTLRVKDFLPTDSNNTNGDQTQALQDAWRELCRSPVPKTLVIYDSEHYVTRPQVFQGPCASNNIHIQIDGTIEAAKDWGSNFESWLWFDSVTGLTIDGHGVLNAHGESWWPNPKAFRPHAVMFNGCKYLTYKGLTQMNSPLNHISITSSTTVTLAHLHLIAPANSPNTDGIDISSSNDIHISSSTIETGDDCVAVNAGSYNINITEVICGPGHGISIGSLGKGGATEYVSDVTVRHCTFKGTQNGARVKTWAGGLGSAKNILFEDITLINAYNPIHIDQKYYGPAASISKANAVQVSDVTFRSFRGTCANGLAINLICDHVGCYNIVLEHIHITSPPGVSPYAICQFAHVYTSDVSIDVKCSFNRKLQLPSPSTQHAQPTESFPLPYIV